MICPNWSHFRSLFASSSTLGVDGVEAWPVDLLRANGFSGGFTGIARPITAFPITVSCNGQASDGGAAFDWYLSQRTDDSALQWISIAYLSSTQSGTVVLSLTAKCVTDLGLAGATATLTEDELREILRHVSLYVRRVSDGSIQFVELLRYTLSSI